VAHVNRTRLCGAESLASHLPSRDSRRPHTLQVKVNRQLQAKADDE
jgi:hypothetical protein